MTINKFDAWIFQPFKINRLRKQFYNGWLGWYSWVIIDEKLCEDISYVNIRPWWGALVLRHEIGHSVVTNRAIKYVTPDYIVVKLDGTEKEVAPGIYKKPITDEQATPKPYLDADAIYSANVDWDKRSWHGIKFWEKP
jgi:hypothetical protein